MESRHCLSLAAAPSQNLTHARGSCRPIPGRRRREQRQWWSPRCSSFPGSSSFPKGVHVCAVSECVCVCVFVCLCARLCFCVCSHAFREPLLEPCLCLSCKMASSPRARRNIGTSKARENTRTPQPDISASFVTMSSPYCPVRENLSKSRSAGELRAEAVKALLG